MSRIERPATAFPLTPATRKRPRQKNDAHLDFIRALPCLITGSRIEVEAAHVRYGSLAHGKPESGIAAKPSDRWTVPLCARVHRYGSKAQHRSNEREWWRHRGVDPLIVAALLWSASGDIEAGETIIRATQAGYFRSHIK